MINPSSQNISSLWILRANDEIKLKCFQTSIMKRVNIPLGKYTNSYGGTIKTDTETESRIFSVWFGFLRFNNKIIAYVLSIKD